MATILVVDDRPINRQFLVTLLGYSGHRLLEAANGVAALELVHAERPDLVITDILMPRMDGFQFTQQLRAEPELSDTKVIFYTATYSVRDATKLADACGVSVVLPKPSEPLVILNAVNEALALEPAPEPPPVELPKRASDLDEGAALTEISADITEHLSDLQTVRLMFDRLLEQGKQLAAERKKLRDISTKFGANVAHLETLTGRLCALVELRLSLITKRDLKQMLETFCRAARKIVNVERVTLAVMDDTGQGPAYCLSFGSGTDEMIRNDRLAAEGSKEVMDLQGRGSLRLSGKAAGAQAGKLPDPISGAKSLFSVPVATTTKRYGLLWFVNRQGAEEFNDEDEEFAVTLAAELAMLQENLEFYRLVQQHAAGLQLEIVEREKAEQGIKRLNRVYAVLSGINTTIVRVKDRQELFNEACRIAVEHGNFGIAWIGSFDPQTLDITPVAWAGLEAKEFLGNLKSSARADHPQGQGVAGRAIRERKPVFINDIVAESGIGARRQEAIRRGYHSRIALPLMVDNDPIGVIVLFAKEKDFFTEEELKLLTELARDISFALEVIEKEKKIHHLAYYDALTGLPNRALFIDRAGQQMRTRGGEPMMVALILLNLERFRYINETLGRHGGDELLKLVARRLESTFHGKDYLARIGADGFGVVIRGVRDAAEIAHAVENQVLACFKEPFAVNQEELRATARAGVALFPADGGDADTLFKNGEAALKQAKAAGERYLFYQHQMNAKVAKTLLLENKMRRALELEQFVLHYQPKVNIANGRISGLEALIRWNDPDTGLVPPIKFIPLLEETGMILDVGRWAIQRALSDYREWYKQGLQPPRIAVNVSLIQLRQKDFVDIVRDAIKASAEEFHGLDLEITESMIMEDIEGNVEKLQAIRDMGVNIAIDDFGTGYSSLGYLAKLPVDALKIDRSFIIKMTGDSDSMTIVSTIISLAHALKLKVVAEGVDAEEQRKILHLLRCDELQGYLFSKPLPAAEIEPLLRAKAQSVP